MLNFGHFWAPFEDVRSATILNFGHFWAALLKMSRSAPVLNFGHFWAPSLVTLLTFQNVINPARELSCRLRAISCSGVSDDR